MEKLIIVFSFLREISAIVLNKYKNKEIQQFFLNEINEIDKYFKKDKNYRYVSEKRNSFTHRENPHDCVILNGSKKTIIIYHPLYELNESIKVFEWLYLRICTVQKKFFCMLKNMGVLQNYTVVGVEKWYWNLSFKRIQQKGIIQMDEFWQTFLIATIPSIITALLSYLAALKASNTQIKAIKEQNKADIEKLVEQNKVDLESLKEKHLLEMEAKEKEYNYQIELIKLQHENDLKKDEENMKNQFAADTLKELFSGVFSQDSPISNKINEVISKSLEDTMKNKDKKWN